MPNVFYNSPATRQTFNLNGDLSIQTANEMRGYKYAYTLNAHSISSATLDAHSVSVPLISTDDAMLDELRHAFELDLAAEKPGYIKVDEYIIPIYCTGSKADLISPRVKKVKLDIVMLDEWMKPEQLQFFSDPPTKGGYDFPHDFMHDYIATGSSRGISVHGYKPTECAITIYGAVSNPQITIGDNVFKVNTILTESERLTIDGRTKTIEKVTQDGTVENIFHLGERGEGENSGMYCFEKLKPGSNLVSWDGTFGFDLTMYYKDVVVPWSL